MNLKYLEIELPLNKTIPEYLLELLHNVSTVTLEDVFLK